MRSFLFSIISLLFIACSSTEQGEDLNSAHCLESYQSIELQKYHIRLEPMVEQLGCGVLPFLASVIEAERIEILDAIEEDIALLELINRLYDSDKIFTEQVIYHKKFNSSLTPNFLANLTYLVDKEFGSREAKELKSYPDSIDYYVLSALHAKSPKETIELYETMRSSVSLKLVSTFVLVHNAVGDVYSFNLLLENFAVLRKNLLEEELKVFASYPQYIAYFLYPSQEDLSIKTLSKSKLREVQRRIQAEALYLYQAVYDHYRYQSEFNHTEYALLTVENIYPYLLDSKNQDIDEDDFQSFFKRLIQRDELYVLFDANDKCSKTTQENFAIFGEGNIQKSISLLDEESRFASTLFDQATLNSFLYIANLYGAVGDDQWEITQKLLEKLPYMDMHTKIYLVQRIEESGYFQNVLNHKDYNEMIHGIEGNYEKYLYVLMTAYPHKNSPLLFTQVMDKKINQKQLSEALNDLLAKDKEELEKHLFSTKDKVVNTLETAETVAFIVGAPFAGGANLMAVSRKYIVKKGTKFLAKKIWKESRKMNKYTKRIGNNVDRVENGAMLSRDAIEYYPNQRSANEAQSLCEE